MASFGEVDLGTSGAAVFDLTAESADEDYSYGFPDGTEVVIPAGSRYVVVRQCPGSDFAQVHAHAREAANRAIDIYFGQGSRPLVIAHKDSPYIVCWLASAVRTLRVVSRTQVSVRFQAKGVVRDASGNVVVQPPPPPKIWHESLRYYRISESSADLYDSFRNLYLALESLLSRVVPPVIKQNGNSEGDSEWLERALRVLGSTMDLRLYAPASPKAPHNAIHGELYVNLRTAIFHAKTGWSTWMPQDWTTRAEIVEARLRYARLYRALAAQYLDIGYPSGGFSKTFWEDSFATTFLANHNVFVSNDATAVEDEPKGQYQLSPAGGAFLVLPTRPADEMAVDWCRGVIGTETSDVVQTSVGEIRRVGTLQDAELALVESLRAPLTVEGVDQLEVVLLLEGRSYGQPRQDFES